MPGTIIATAILGSAAVGSTIFAATAFAVNFAASLIVSRVFASMADTNQGNTSSRQQMPPAADNALPVVYGTASLGGTFVDAALTVNGQNMYYVMALSHKSDSGQISFDYDNFWYADQKIVFDAVDKTYVSGLVDGEGNTDTTIAGRLRIYLYHSTQAGVITAVNTTQMPHQIMGGVDLDAAVRWPSTGRQMNGLVFAIVTLNYAQSLGVTNLNPITFRMSHTLNSTGVAKPGDVLYDYLTNTIYGGAVPAAYVNSTACAALNTYSDATITYTPSGGGSATQARYRINGLIDTGQPVLRNVDDIMTACDSWLSYQAETGQWSPVINKAESTAFAFNDTNIIGEIRVSVTDLSSTYNQIEASFNDKTNRDQANYVRLSTPPGLLYTNEPPNKLSTDFALVNDSVQAQYLANRILEQAREDLIVSFSTAYPGLQVNAGDVVSVTNADYGWTAKLFRVTRVNEASLPDGNLGARVELSEYNASVYDDATITQYAAAANTGIASTQYFSTLTTPTTATYPTLANPNIKVTCTMPATGLVSYIKLFYTTVAAPTPADYILYNIFSQSSATSTSNGQYSNGVAYQLPDVVLTAGTYYFAFSVGNSNGESALSPKTSAVVWAPAPSATYISTGTIDSGTTQDANIGIGTTEVVVGTYEASIFVRKEATNNSLINIVSQNNIDDRLTIWGHKGNSSYGVGNAVSGSFTSANTYSSWQLLGILASGATSAGVWGLAYAPNTGTVAGLFERYSGTNSDSPGSLSTQVQLATASYSIFSPTGGGKYYIQDGAGPFTGFHEAMLPIAETVEIGDIVVDTSVFFKLNISNVLMNGTKSISPSQSRAIGVVSALLDVDTAVPGILWESEQVADPRNEFGEVSKLVLRPGFDLATLQSTYKVAQVNAVGEGQVNVCGEGGDIQPGDLIVTSSMAGKGMKQADDIVRSVTVAKAREAAVFASPTEVKQIACIYVGG